MRPLWLDSEAVEVAEQCAEAVGVPVARFVERVLFELCGVPQPRKRAAGGTNTRAVRRLAQVIRIDRRVRR